MARFAKLIRTILAQWDITALPREHGIKLSSRKVLDARVAGMQCDIPRHPRVEALTVKSVLTKRPSVLHCLNADATSLEALKLMAEHDIGAVLVMDGSRFIGIFTERDHARNSIRATQSVTSIPLREAMTSCDISANLADSVPKCLALMADHRMRFLPVQEDGRPVAMLSLDDLLNEMVAYLERILKENQLDQQVVFLRGTYSC